ncbi:MAG: HisA/HisF-related TIM barrel protein [Armatimonadota bacterium]|nr:HisA/HisF-related TIM barrel protein [Armatimonadota bacterium]
MEVIPGIDLMDGKSVCPVHMSFARTGVFSHNPVEVAKVWADQGATRLYLADLDGARMGDPQNLNAIPAILNAIPEGLRLDFGGGIRSLKQAKQVLNAGADRIVIGTTAALEEELAQEILDALGSRTIISVASLNGYVAVRDWQARTDERAEDFAKRMVALGAKRLVFTDVSRKGLHGGVNVSAVKRMAEAVPVPIIASGGVRNIQDIKALKKLEPLGVEAVVVVTALYSGTLTLSEALAAAQCEDD